MGKEVMVTGGAGFIGSNFIRHLLNHTNCQITNIDTITYAGNLGNIAEFGEKPNYRFNKTNIANSLELETAFDRKYDIIVHFAAESHVDRSIEKADSFIQSNIVGTYNLLQKVLEGKARKMIHISTDEVYGSLDVEEMAFSESSPISPNNPYSSSKASADLLCRSFYKTYQLPVIITRCSNNYGPRQHPEKFIPKTIIHALNNKEIPVYGKGMNRRDWIYVEDHCRAIHAVMEHGKSGEVYNIGGSCEKTNIETVKHILSVLGKPHSLITFVEDRKGHDLRYAINWGKIHKVLGWKPSVYFEEGIEKTIEWYRLHSQWIEQVLDKRDAQ